MDFLIMFFGVAVILGLVGVVSALGNLCRLMKQLMDLLLEPDKGTMIKLIEELHEIRLSIEGVSQKIRDDERREEMELGLELGAQALAENRDQGNPDLIEVLEDIRDK